MFLGSYLIIKKISEGDVCLVGKALWRDVSSDYFIWLACSNLFISRCRQKLLAKYIAKILVLSIILCIISVQRRNNIYLLKKVFNRLPQGFF